MPHHDVWSRSDMFWSVLLLVLVAALVGFLVWMVVSGRNKSVPASSAPLPPASPTRPIDGALEHARMRYARGEMSREEYLQVVQDLGGPAPPVTP